MARTYKKFRFDGSFALPLSRAAKDAGAENPGGVSRALQRRKGVHGTEGC